MRILGKPVKVINYLVRKIRYIGSTLKGTGELCIHPSAKIQGCDIRVDKNSKLILAEHTCLKNVELTITNGSTVCLAPYAELRQNTNPTRPHYIVNNGKLTVGHHSSLRAARVWVRFGGECRIGCYVSINDGSEIRADEKVEIGDYGMLSYNLRIWDTNTHTIYSAEKRAALKRDHFPDSGYECERPKTAPVIIGKYSWIGERSTILKGSVIGDDVIIGYNTLISNTTIPAHKVVVQKPELVLYQKEKSEADRANPPVAAAPETPKTT